MKTFLMTEMIVSERPMSHTWSVFHEHKWTDWVIHLKRLSWPEGKGLQVDAQVILRYELGGQLLDVQGELNSYAAEKGLQLRFLHADARGTWKLDLEYAGIKRTTITSQIEIEYTSFKGRALFFWWNKILKEQMLSSLEKLKQMCEKTTAPVNTEQPSPQ